MEQCHPQLRWVVPSQLTISRSSMVDVPKADLIWRNLTGMLGGFSSR